MLSNRPYLLRAFYQWIVDSECTPILVIDATHPRTKIPKEYVEDGEIVFNITPIAVRDFKITNECIAFKASFSGVIHIISAPIKSILAIYAEENGEGLFFDEDEDEDADDGSAGPYIMKEEDYARSKQASSKRAKSPKPFLKLVE